MRQKLNSAKASIAVGGGQKDRRFFAGVRGIADQDELSKFVSKLEKFPHLNAFKTPKNLDKAP